MQPGKHTPTVHHRQPKSKGGGDFSKGGRKNISLIQRQYHQAWHLLFGNREAVEIAEIINNEYLDPDYELVCKKKGEHEKKESSG